MTLVSIKPENNGGGGGDRPKLNYQGVTDSIEEDVHLACISGIIDLGVQKRPVNFEYNDGKTKEVFETVVATEEEAEDLLAEMEEVVWDKHVKELNLNSCEPVEATEDDVKSLGVELGSEVFVLPFIRKQPKDARLFVFTADFLEKYVEWIEDSGNKVQYRAVFNKKDFDSKELKGYSLGTMPSNPTDRNSYWTFAGNSMIAKLLKATGNEAVLKDPALDNDIACLLGAYLGVDMAKNHKNGKDYLKDPVPQKLSRRDLQTIEEKGLKLDNEPVAILFDTATLEDFQTFRPNFDIIKVMKKANNYKGNIKEVVEAYEVWNAAQQAEDKVASDKPVATKKEPAAEKEGVAPKSRARVSSTRTKPASTRKSAADVDFDDDIPF